MKTILALLLLTALPTFARLGETKAECEARYGKPLGTTEAGNTLYRKADLKIAIVFWKDKAATLFIAKATPGAGERDFDGVDSNGDKRERISDAEIDVLLKTNTGDSVWERDENCSDPFAEKAWKRADGKAVAVYTPHRLELRDEVAQAQIEKQQGGNLNELARLGETKAECEKRCGKPVFTDEDGNVLYRKDGFAILITYWKDKAANLAISKSKPDFSGSEPDDSQPISDDEIALILEGVSGNSKWKADGSDGENSEVKWRRDGKGTVAAYDTHSYTLIVYTEEYADHMEEMEKAKPEKAK